MSEAEEFSRMSELTEASDEDEVNVCEYDDIPEADEELGTWEENEIVRPNDVTDEELDPSSATASTKSTSKPYVINNSVCVIL